MALVKFGGGVVGMAGSIAGTTFARNRYGAYARARTKPVNPNTALQQAVRATMAFLTQRWSLTLNAAQRAAWNLYGANVVMKNRLGENINLSGFNHYIRSNSFLRVIGMALVDAGPVVFEIPEKDPTFAATGSEGTQTFQITADNTLAWANETQGFLGVFQGTPQNPQRNFFAGPWRWAGFYAGDPVAPPGFPLGLNAQFAIAELQRDWLYARIVRADGRLSQPFRADCFVGA